jgi:hypothetical protein
MIDLEAAAEFVHLNARLIERRRFAYLFGDGPAEGVIAAVRAYRNGDGGFGQGLEPDLRDPESQPAAVMHAAEFLAEAGAGDDPMLVEACDWLLTVTRDDGGVPFVLPTVLESRSGGPWRQPADESSMIMTAEVAAMLHRAGASHPWLERAGEWLWRNIPQLGADGAYAWRFALDFLDVVPDAERAEAVLAEVGPRLLSSGLVTLDPDAHGEVHSPLDFSPWPDSRTRRLFDAPAIERDLDRLEAGQQDDGGWTFDWPAWSPRATLDWRGFVTVHALKVLRANGRLAAGTLPADADDPAARHAQR